MNYVKRISSLFSMVIVLFLLGVSCKSARLHEAGKMLYRHMEDPFYQNQFTGLFVWDPETSDTLINYNGNKYFTPASNTKIFTLYTALTLLPEQLPSLKYTYRNDTLYFRGTGDPTLLHPKFQETRALDFLKNFEILVFDTSNFKEKYLGPGWSWDDYDSYYTAERSSLPLYGNIAKAVQTEKGIKAVPDFFSWEVHPSPGYYRKRFQNLFYIPQQETDTMEVPFRTDVSSLADLLCHHLNRTVLLGNAKDVEYDKIIYGSPLDPILKQMMQTSDNFLAEQLLIMSAGVLSDTLDGEIARKYMMNNVMRDLKHKPRWVDGSGLSRYNLFTPQSMVQVLHHIYQEYSWDLIEEWFPAGGKSGTLKNFFKGDSVPYVFAKTGTLSNNYCLSGYLHTRSGKILIFSFMNNHYMVNSADVKTEMEKSLRWLYENY